MMTTDHQKEHTMVTVTITATGYQVPLRFDATAEEAEVYTSQLADPNGVITAAPPFGGVAYIPVRHITCVHLADGSTEGAAA